MRPLDHYGARLNAGRQPHREAEAVEVAETHCAVRAEQLRRYAENIVANWPPLTPDQTTRIVAALQWGSDGTRGHRRIVRT
jgi:hypothetical protein